MCLGVNGSEAGRFCIEKKKRKKTGHSEFMPL